MKLHKLNKQGTLAVVIPKDIATMLSWKENDDIIVTITEEKHTLKLINQSLKETLSYRLESS